MDIRSESGRTYACPKCKCTDWDVGQLRASGGGLAAIFDLETRNFTSITCTRCFYTEFYRVDPSTLTNVVDFFVG